jgi:SH3-like domain-containing protein
VNPAARILAVAVAAFAATLAGAVEYRTIGERPAVLYDAPSQKADKLFVAGRNYPFEVLVKLDLWTKVRDVNGEVAWVENKALGERRMVMVNVPLADIRAQANAQAAVVFEGARNLLLEALEPAQDGWLKVRHRDGATGYIRVAHVWGD